MLYQRWILASNSSASKFKKWFWTKGAKSLTSNKHLIIKFVGNIQYDKTGYTIRMIPFWWYWYISVCVLSINSDNRGKKTWGTILKRPGSDFERMNVVFKMNKLNLFVLSDSPKLLHDNGSSNNISLLLAKKSILTPYLVLIALNLLIG